MANFIGKVRMAGEYAFQNKRGAEGNISDPGPQIYEGDIYIPDIRTVDFSKFLKRYTYDDVNEERPFYIFKWQRQFGTTESIKLPMANDTKITFFYNDRLNDTVGMTVGDLNSYGIYSNIYGHIDGNMYGYCYPFTSVGLTAEAPIDRIYDPSCTWITGTGGISRSDLLAKAAIDNNDINGFIPKYDPNLDAYLIAGTTRNVNNISDRGYYFYGKDDRLSMYNIYTNYTTSRAEREITGVENKRQVRVGTNSSTGFTLVNNSGDQVTIKIPYLHKSYFTYEYFTTMIGSPASMGTYALLRDGNTGEYWIMIVNRDGLSSGGESVNYVILTQFRNCYTSIASTSNVDGTIAPAFRYVDESTFGNLDDFLTDLFSVQKEPSYSDDSAPNISGPGDPYGEIDNVDGIVGGRPSVEKEVNEIDASPNNAYNRLLTSTSYFGSYSLTTDDLEQYTHTLSELYAHANNIFIGESCQAIADRISNSVTSLHFLPVNIPGEDVSNTIFSLGNTGIMGNGTWAQYVAENNYASANYLTKLTKIESFELGEIKHNYDNFLDFAPYSSASLYIPYVGKVELPINLIQSTDTDHRPLRVEFRINYTNGDFIAILFCEINGNEIPISYWNGNCANSIKVSVNDDSDAIRAGANRIASMVTGSFGMSGSMSNNLGMSASTTNSSSSHYNAGSYNGKLGTSTTSGYAVGESTGTSASQGFGSGGHGGLSFNAPAMPSSVTSNQHMIGNGSVDGSLGYLGIQKIVLTVERPIWWRPYDYGDMIGYPTKKIAKLSSIKGFAKVTQAHIKCSATDDEKNEILSLISSGVIF